MSALKLKGVFQLICFIGIYNYTKDRPSVVNTSRAQTTIDIHGINLEVSEVI